jgi:tetratricopeptide (TPR) repeat protein
VRYEIADKLIENTQARQRRGSHKIGLRWVLEYLVWLFIISMLAVIFALTVLSPAFAGISATVKATKEKGFGRIVIGFSDLPKFKDELASGIFVLSFDQPVDVDLEPVLEAIPEYVGMVRRDPDGRALRFALKRSYQINIMQAGNELFVDLLPPDWKGLSPSLPSATIKALTETAIAVERRAADKAAQRKSAKIPFRLKVRLARHPTFSRIVLDWNKFVTVDLTRKGRTVDIKFDQSAKVDLSQLKVDPPKFLQNVHAQTTPDGMTVSFTIDEDVDVRGFREGLNYVLDLTGPDALAEASAAAVADKVGAKKTPGAAGKNAVPEGKKEMLLLAGKRKKQAEEKTTRNSSIAIVTKDIDPAILSSKSFESSSAVSPDVSVTVVAKSNSASENKVAPPASDGEKKTAPQKGAPKGENEAKNKPPAMTASSVPSSDAGINALASGAGLRVTFQFSKPVAAAMFRRGRSIWTVFDSDAQLDLSDLRTRAKNMVEDIQQVRFGSAQYVRIKLKEPQLAHVSHSNNGWHLTIGDMATGKTNPLQLVRALRDDKRSLIKIAMKDYGRVHWLTDPEIGDRLAVVTALPPQRNIAKPQELVDFSVFPTAHGLAIRPRTDDVAVRLHLDEVLITRRDGLTLSAGNTSQYVAGKKALRNSARIGFIDYKRWRIESPSELSNKIHEMQRLAAQAPQAEMNARRFDLATLYTTNYLYAESLGLLHRMEDVDEDIVTDPAYNMLRGATLVFMGRLKEARKDFEIHALANDSDASLWRGYIASRERKWANALDHFKEGADAVGSYRADIMARFRLAAVRAALELDKLSRAAQELNAVPRKGLPKAVKAELQLLTGRYLEYLGRNEEARESYKAALESDVPSVVAEARLHSTTLDLKTGRIDRKQALRTLESLQLFWRGDEIELRTLRMLAELYVKEKSYRDAFTVMRNSIEAFPKQKLALQIQDDMKQVFKDLFLHGESEKMNAVAALSLYYGYRELTPVGRLGDEMIRRLSDRLVSVDLLDQASELLDHQVHKRLKGAARAQVATRLAMVHLMNHKSDVALGVIRRTRQAGLPEDLQKSRNLLEARALGELGRAAAAVEILNTMDGKAVERLKADAYWVAQEWKNVGTQIEMMLGGRWRESGPLSDSDRFDVLRAAIGYSLASDQFALDRLRKKYYPKLLKTRDADSFLLVTKPIKSKGVAFRNLAKEIAAIDTLDAFMKEFRASYDRTSAKPKASLKTDSGQAG